MEATHSSELFPHPWESLPLEKDIKALEAYLQNCQVDYSYFHGRKFLYQGESLSLNQLKERATSIYLRATKALRQDCCYLSESEKKSSPATFTQFLATYPDFSAFNQTVRSAKELFNSRILQLDSASEAQLERSQPSWLFRLILKLHRLFNRIPHQNFKLELYFKNSAIPEKRFGPSSMRSMELFFNRAYNPLHLWDITQDTSIKTKKHHCERNGTFVEVERTCVYQDFHNVMENVFFPLHDHVIFESKAMFVKLTNDIQELLKPKPFTVTPNVYLKVQKWLDENEEWKPLYEGHIVIHQKAVPQFVVSPQGVVSESQGDEELISEIELRQLSEIIQLFKNEKTLEQEVPLLEKQLEDLHTQIKKHFPGFCQFEKPSAAYQKQLVIADDPLPAHIPIDTPEALSAEEAKLRETALSKHILTCITNANATTDPLKKRNHYSKIFRYPQLQGKSPLPLNLSQAYHALSRIYHPDRNVHAPTTAQEITVLINKAFSFLRG